MERNGALSVVVALLLFALFPTVTALGIGPGTVTLPYKPGNVETVSMIALNQVEQEWNFTVSSSVEFIKCVPSGEFAIASMASKPFTCTVRIPTLNLPPGVHEIGRVRLSEVAPPGIGIGAVGVVVSIFRVNIPNDGPYLQMGLAIQSVPRGQRAAGMLNLASVGTEAIGETQGTLSVQDATGAPVVSLPPFTIGPFAVGDEEQVPFTLETEKLQSGNYRAIAEVPYSSKVARAESGFKIGEMRIDIKNLTAAPVKPNETAKLILETENFWGEELEYNVELIIRKNGQEVRRVSDRIERIKPWETRSTALYWETTDVLPGTYDIRVVLRYSGKETTRDFPNAITILAPEPAVLPEREMDWRLPLLISMGVLILIIAVLLIVLLRKNREQPQQP